jgi:hypothetical protein
MHRTLLILSLVATGLFCCASGTIAQGPVDPQFWNAYHRSDIRTWAVKSGFSVATVRELLEAIGRDEGVGEDAEGDVYSIQNIDARSLARRRQILVALTGPATGHTLFVFVIQSRRPYAVIWDASDLEGTDTCPTVPFATSSILGEAEAAVANDGDIVIRMPVEQEFGGTDPYSREQKSQLIVATYAWSGKTYRLKSERTYPSYHWNGRNFATIGPGAIRKCDQR